MQPLECVYLKQPLECVYLKQPLECEGATTPAKRG
jgi:hypothetical protein